MVDYNPFEKPLHEVDFEDLESLGENHVSEGYYVEYKRSIPGSQPGYSVAKVIASFANTYGGWFFLGITESFNNEAGAPIGISLSDYPQPKETIRQWVRTQVDPNPDFESHLVQNPEFEDFAVVVILVPESNHTPHILADGVIYRRSGEESNPIEPETERWVLDRLYEGRAERERKRDRVLQHLRAIENEIGLNKETAHGNSSVIRAIQESGPTADHYVVELLSTDAWDAALDEQLIGVVDLELYSDLQSLYYLKKRTNELTKRLRTEILHPSMGQTVERMGRQSKVWTITVTHWDPRQEKVDSTGLGPLIRRNFAKVEASIRECREGLEQEIQRLEIDNSDSPTG